MKQLQQFFKRLNDWIFQGMHLPVIIAVFIIAAVAITVTIVSILNRPESNIVTVFVTVEGLEDGNNFENRQIKITDGDTISNIFSLKYNEIYEAFGRPLIQYNEFQSFIEKKKTAEKSFHVTIDGVFDNNLSQAYVYEGQTIVISYY